MKSYPSFVDKHYALGENFFELVGPNSTVIGMFASPIICMIPLSMEIAFSNLFERAVTSGDAETVLVCKVAHLA